MVLLFLHAAGALPQAVRFTPLNDTYVMEIKPHGSIVQ